MQNSAGASSAQFIKMTQTPIPKLIVTLAVPTVASMLVSSIYNLADTFFVGQLKSNSATGAVGVVFSLMAILQAFGFMVGMGSGSVISRLLGQQEGQKASHIASMGFFTSLGCGALLGVGGLIFLEPLMRLLGATDTILPYACDYGRYILAAAPLMCASFTMNNMLRYEGKAAFAMIGLTTGGILNILLDPLFIFVFDMGIAGAALATALSQCVSFCLLLAMFLVGKSQLRLSVRLIGRDLPGLKNILACGLPSFARQALASVATALLNWQAGQCGGDAAVAAMSVVGRIFMFVFAFSSLISYYSMSEANLRFIKDSKKGLFILRVVVVLAVFIACIIPVSMVWNLMDLFMAVMAILNIYALFHLYKYVVAAHDDYRKQKDAGVEVPEFFVDNIKDSGLDTSGITVWDKE